jgi:hypothetical protein
MNITCKWDISYMWNAVKYICFKYFVLFNYFIISVGFIGFVIVYHSFIALVWQDSFIQKDARGLHLQHSISVLQTMAIFLYAMQYYHYYCLPRFDISDESNCSCTVSLFSLKADGADYFSRFHIDNILNAYSILMRKSEGKWPFQ